MLRAAGLAVLVSGVITLLLSVAAFGTILIFALVPAIVGLFQARSGMWVVVRREAVGWPPLAAAGLGSLVGLLHLPDGILNPMGDDREVVRLALGVYLLATNAVAAWVFASHGGAHPSPASSRHRRRS